MDECDVPLVSGHCWSADIQKMADGRLRVSARVSRLGRLHKVLTGFPLCDHKDGDPLNNRRSNLRSASYSQNCANAVKKSKNRYKGVEFCNGCSLNPYRYRVMKDGVFYGGHASTEAEAAVRYNELALKIHGEFANLNEVAA